MEGGRGGDFFPRELCALDGNIVLKFRHWVLGRQCLSLLVNCSGQVITHVPLVGVIREQGQRAHSLSPGMVMAGLSQGQYKV